MSKAIVISWSLYRHDGPPTTVFLLDKGTNPSSHLYRQPEAIIVTRADGVARSYPWSERRERIMTSAWEQPRDAARLLTITEITDTCLTWIDPTLNDFLAFSPQDLARMRREGWRNVPPIYENM